MTSPPEMASAINDPDTHLDHLADAGRAAAHALRAAAERRDASVSGAPTRVLQRWLRAAIESLAEDDDRRAVLDTEWRFQQLYRFEDLPTLETEQMTASLATRGQTSPRIDTSSWLDRLGEGDASGTVRRAPRALWIAEQLLDIAWSLDTPPNAGRARAPDDDAERLHRHQTFDPSAAAAWLRGFHQIQPLAAIERGALPVLVRSVAALRLLGESEPLGLQRPAGFEPPRQTQGWRPEHLTRVAQNASQLTRCWPS